MLISFQDDNKTNVSCMLDDLAMQKGEKRKKREKCKKQRKKTDDTKKKVRTREKNALSPSIYRCEIFNRESLFGSVGNVREKVRCDEIFF